MEFECNSGVTFDAKIAIEQAKPKYQSVVSCERAKRDALVRRFESQNFQSFFCRYGSFGADAETWVEVVPTGDQRWDAARLWILWPSQAIPTSLVHYLALCHLLLSYGQVARDLIDYKRRVIGQEKVLVFKVFIDIIGSISFQFVCTVLRLIWSCFLCHAFFLFLSTSCVGLKRCTKVHN